MKPRSALARLRKIKTQSVLDRLSKESREFILNSDVPECSGSNNPKYKISYDKKISTSMKKWIIYLYENINLNNRIFTGLYDDNNEQIFVDDILYNTDGYYIIVKCDNNKTDYHGVLISNYSSCKDMLYHLNNGNGHLKVNIRKFINEI